MKTNLPKTLDQETISVFRDLYRYSHKDDGDYLPSEDRANECFDKLKCKLKNGQRIYWYYQEDLDYSKQWKFNIQFQPPYSGILIYKNDTNTQFYPEIDRCIIVVDDYPVEKCAPEVYWIALNRLLNDENLIEVFSKQ